MAELHLGGFTPETDGGPGQGLLVDTHAGPIAAAVWELYAHALRRFGATPTLIEWDDRLSTFAALLAEAERADSVVASMLDEIVPHAAAR